MQKGCGKMYTSILQKIPVLAVAVVLAVALVRIYLRSKNVTHSEFIKILKSAKYKAPRVFIVVCIFTLIFGFFHHMQSKQSVQAVVSLNYSEASLAQNSNGTRYNMSEIICDEVIDKAIKAGALEGVSVKELKKCLSVQPYVQGGAQNESEYHISTEFIVRYHASKDTQHLDAENVIKLITSAYKEYYIEKYTDNFKLDTEEERPDFAKMEYMDIVSYFNKETTAILNYLYGMAGKGPSFVTKNNTTFNSIAGEVYQFRETQIKENLRSLILQQGVVRNRTEYVDRLSYQNTNKDFERRRNAASFDTSNQAIAMYSEEMTRVVLVPTWDETGKYYMGRTKVGIDELSVQAAGFSDMVASNEKDIMDNNLIIGKMQEGAGDLQTYEPADTLITSIDQSIRKFGEEAIAAGREFSNYRMNQCIASSISGASLFGELKTIIVFAIFTYVAVILYAISKKFPRRG